MMRLPIVFVMTCVVWIRAGKILLIPYDHQAHVNFFSIIGEELQKRGHHVDIIVADRSQHLAADRGLHTIVQSYPQTLNTTYFEKVSQGDTRSLLRAGRDIRDTAILHTRQILQDKKLIDHLNSLQYDIAIIDGADPVRAQFLIPYRLGLKYITVSVRNDPFYASVPSLPSVEGMPPFFVLDEQSTFFDRLRNTLLLFTFYFFIEPPSYLSGISDSLFTELVPDLPNVGFKRLFKESEMFLIVMDVMCTDSIRVSAPHYRYIGGLSALPPQPLNTKLNTFMTSANNGAIVMSFGTGLPIPMPMLEEMMSVFNELKQKVVLRHTADIQFVVPSNVLVQAWIPQNDLLGHINTRLFITHSGASSQHESVYHGVPMLMIPFFGDQMYNTLRAEKRGYGLSLMPKEFNAHDFETKILELLNNPVYSINTKKCSRILRDLPTPRQNAAFWVEHVIAHGSEHLRPYYIHMPIWRMFMLDVLLFLCCAVSFLCFVVWFCCSKIYYRCRFKSKVD